MKKLVIAGFLFVASALAQLDRGALVGTVTDPSNALIPGVKVIVTQTATGATYETVTNVNGQFLVPNLPIGPYRLVFEAPSFKKLERLGVTVNATQTQRVDAALEVGSTAESIQVSASIPRIQTDSPETGTTIDNKQMIDLPFNFSGGRLMENLTHKIAAGVNGNRWQDNSNGLQFFSKDVLLDGASVSSWAPGIFVLTAVSMEAVQEYKMQTGGVSAEFGRSAGGISNYVMKSGANEIHGSAYGSIRNEAFNANTLVNNARGLKRPLERKQNYAFSFGGRVYLPKIYNGRNKTFFYVAYENYRDNNFVLGAPNRTVPLPEFYDGDFSRLLGPATGLTDALGRPVAKGAIYDPATFRQLDNGRWIGEMFPGNKIPVNRFSAVSKNFLSVAKQNYLPTVVGSNGLVPLQNNSYAPINVIPVTTDAFFSIKGDHIISTRHKLSGVWTIDDEARTLDNNGGIFDVSQGVLGGPLGAVALEKVFGQNARLSHDWTLSPRLLNHITLSYTRNSRPTQTAQYQIDGAKALGIKGLSTIGYPQINWGSGPFVTLDPAGYPFRNNVIGESWGFLNTTSFSRGRHFMKAGFDFRNNARSLVSTPGGSFTFSPLATAIPGEAFSGSQTGYSFASFLLGTVNQSQLDDPATLGQHRHYYALFFQDDFKVSRRLTLNLGLRWEYAPPLFEAADRLSSWNPSRADPVSGRLGAYDFAGSCSACTGSRSFGRSSRRDFAPRIGFAYRFSDTLTMRGSYGIMFSPDMPGGPATPGTPLGKATNVQANGTWALSPNATQPWAGIFNWDTGIPNSLYTPASYDISWGDRNAPGMFDPNYGRTGYVQSWNLNVQRQLPGGFVLDVGYAGNKATGLRISELGTLDQLSPSLLQTYGRTLTNSVRSAADAAANGIAYPYAGFAGSVASALRPYPQVQGNSTVSVFGSPLGFSMYHSLQTVVNREFHSGLTLYSNWVWSKALGNVRSLNTADNPNRPINTYNLSLEKSVLDYDRPHFVKVFAVYELPVGRGKALLGGANKAVSAILGGWSLSPILQYASGTPLGFVTNTSPLPGFWNGTVNRANIAPGDLKSSSFGKGNFDIINQGSSKNTYLNKSLFSDPAQLTLGTSAYAYTQARDFGIMSEDLALQKNFHFHERFRIQFRADFLDLFNRHYLGGIVTNPTSPLFGQVTSVGNKDNTETSRTIQFGLRLDF